MIQSLLAFLLRLLLRLRYRIDVRGLKEVGRQRGLLILPNHPGEIDPIILGSRFWPSLRPHPVVVEDFYYAPVTHTILSLMGAVPMPNTFTGLGTYKRRRIRAALDRVVELLNAGENVMIYPSGRLMREQQEVIGGASGLAEILSRCPDVPIMLVRTTGLVGSSFSWIIHRDRPPLWRVMGRGARFVLTNLLFFTPRRPVLVECQAAPPEMPRQADKMTLNRWLEDWYNPSGPEPLTLISYSCWRERLYPMAPPLTGNTDEDLPVPDEVRAQVLAYLGKVAGCPVEQLRPETSMTGELGLDSLAIADLIGWLDETFFVSEVEVASLQTVHDLLQAAVGAGGAGPTRVTEPPAAWTEAPPANGLAAIDLERTVHENFLHTCRDRLNCVAIADDAAGVMTYGRLRTGVVLLAELIHQWPGRHVGIMLPASIGAQMSTLAALLAGKVPVMINWTLGDANLQHVLELSGIERLLTAERFLDRLENLNLDLIGDRLVTLEDLRKTQMPLSLKLRAVSLARKRPAVLCRRYDNTATADDTAVVLFTSGSEAAPKGVPLSHRNVQTNVCAGVDAGIVGSDVMYSFLPPFHSFGFTVTGLLPLLSGLRTACYPNPTEGRRLARGIGHWRPTLICGTPTFVRGICKGARPGQFDSLRLVLTGAEKTPDGLFTTLGQLCRAELIEGYGITECSPILTVNRPGEPRGGVGRPVLGVELCIVNPDTHEPLPQGERGLILARGDSVFSGYLGQDSSKAFTEVNGHRWYITGDLGYLTATGHLELAGRLKRFVKVGGEMISLPALEAAIKDKYPDSEEAVNSAITSFEQDGERPVLALYTTYDIDLETVNDLLRQAGFGNLARLRLVLHRDEIPLLGTGKTDYRTLKDELAAALTAAQ